MVDNKEKRLLLNTAIVGLGSIASKAIFFIMAPLFSRWLSVEDYGSFDVICTYISLLIPIVTLAIPEAVFRMLLDLDDGSRKKEIIVTGILFSLIGCVLFFVVYYILSLLAEVISFLPLFCFLLFAQLFFTLLSEVSRGLKKMVTYSVFNCLSVVLLTGFSVLFLRVFDFRLDGIILGYGVGYFVSGIGLFICLKLGVVMNVSLFSFEALKEMLKYSWPLIPNSISWWIVGLSDRLLISKFLDFTANGVYAVANKVPSVVNVLFSVFHVSWVQSASETICDNDYAKYCNSVFNKLVAFLLSTSAVLIGANFLVYNLLFDVRYFDAYYYTPILIFATALSCIAQFFGGLMIAKKDTKLNGFTNIVAAVSNILINVLFIKQCKLYAAAVSTLFAYLILVVIRWCVTTKYVPIKLSTRNVLNMVFFLLLILGVYLNITCLNYVVFIMAIVFCIVINWGLFGSEIKMLWVRVRGR